MDIISSSLSFGTHYRDIEPTSSSQTSPSPVSLPPGSESHINPSHRMVGLSSLTDDFWEGVRNSIKMILFRSRFHDRLTRRCFLARLRRGSVLCLHATTLPRAWRIVSVGRRTLDGEPESCDSSISNLLLALSERSDCLRIETHIARVVQSVKTG
jgi:hypothetical protein